MCWTSTTIDAPLKPYFVYPIAPGLIEATAFFAQAAKEVGVGSLINMSQISARRDSRSHAARDHWVAERLFDWSDLPVTHLRPTFFAQNFLYPPFVASVVQHGMISFPFGSGRHAPLAGMTWRDISGWVKTIGTARREWWARLSEAERAAHKAAIQTYRKNRRAKAKQRIEQMRRILAAYNDGLTSEEIGALIGVGGRSVRDFAARRGVTVSRGERRFRQIAFEKREEAALKAFAADFGATPTEAVQAIVRAALESDAHPARRLLCVRRRRELAA
jgi:hypothetical protein